MSHHDDNAEAEFLGKNLKSISRCIHVLKEHGYLKMTEQNEMSVTYSICLPRTVSDDTIASVAVCAGSYKSPRAVDKNIPKLSQANENIYVNRDAQSAGTASQNNFLSRVSNSMFSYENSLTVTRAYLGKLYPGIYLSRRESECVYMMMRGMSRQKISACLQISIKTIDFYIQCIKAKLGCQSSREIITCIQRTDFMKNVQNFLRIF